MSEKWKSQGFPTFIHSWSFSPSAVVRFRGGDPKCSDRRKCLGHVAPLVLQSQLCVLGWLQWCGSCVTGRWCHSQPKTTKPSPSPKTENRVPHSSLCLLKDLESAIFEGYTAAFFNPETLRNPPTNRNPPENVDQQRHRKPRASKAAPVVDMGRAKGPATQECRMQPRQPPIFQMFWGFYEHIRIFWGCNQDSSDILRIHNGTQQCSIGETMTMKFNNPWPSQIAKLDGFFLVFKGNWHTDMSGKSPQISHMSPWITQIQVYPILVLYSLLLLRSNCLLIP